ncbi:MAG: DUF6020 family protein [Candidatus Limiplasma sp.]|nr:DUF6020 family protein [Candidatus Limiplasma sp.]
MKTLAKGAAAALLALVSTVALLLAPVDAAEGACTLCWLETLLGTVRAQAAAGTLLWAALCALYAYALRGPAPWRRGERLRLAPLALLFALAGVLGAAYRVDDGMLTDFLSGRHLLLLAGKTAGLFALCWLGLRALLRALPRLATALRPVKPLTARRAVREALTCMAVILCAWLPAWLARYPGALSVDAGRVLQQFSGEIVWTADHPPVYTLLLGGTFRLGAALGGDTFGLALCTALQTLALAGSMALCIAFLAREGAPRALRLGLTVFFALVPMAMGNAAHVIKDVPYTAMFLVYMVCLAHALLHRERLPASARWRVLYGLSALLLLLLRPNGALVVMPTTAVLAVLQWKAAKTAVLPAKQGHIPGTVGKPDKLPRHFGPFGRALTVLLLPLLLAGAFQGWAVPALAYVPESTPDLLGVAFQQTARIVRNDPQAVTADDKAVLDRLLEADALADAYAPHSSDGVRKLFRYWNGHTGEDVLRFVGVWARLTAEHPLTAFHAFWSLSGGFLDPFDTRNPTVSTMPEQDSAKYPHAYTFAHPAALQGYHDRMDSLERSYRSLPLFAQLDAVGLYAWVALFGLWLTRRAERRGLGWLWLPPLLTLTACLFSAGFPAGTRYALPLVLGAPFALCTVLPSVLAGARVPQYMRS